MPDITVKLECPWCDVEIAIPDEDYRKGRFVCPECATVIEMAPDRALGRAWTPVVIEGGKDKGRRRG